MSLLHSTLVICLFIFMLHCLACFSPFYATFSRGGYPDDDLPDTVIEMENDLRAGEAYEPGALLALVDSREQALKIAELYGIELVSEGDGLAKFHTDEDVMTVIDRGIENGWPLLEPNLYYSLF